MKTLKFVAVILAIAAVSSIKVSGQPPVQNVLTVTVDNLDYTGVNPAIGIVSGTYEYHFSYKLSKEGFIEAIHWNARNFNLTNNHGNKVIIIDSGHDTNGDLWVWFNEPNNMNGNINEIVYDCDNGWLDDLMQVQRTDEEGELGIYPRTEGVAVEMSCKILCKGEMFKMPFLSILHINANGVETVNVVKP